MTTVNDNIIFPILDLIKQEVYKAQYINPFEGVPSVVLRREHPEDSSKVIVTGATLTYHSGYVVHINLFFGAMGNPYILDRVHMECYDLNSQHLKKVYAYNTSLYRDERGLLTHTRVDKIA